MTTIEAVALHLQREAVRRHTSSSEGDGFGRSAFNRYYYATFLCARNTIIRLDSKWRSLPHADYPPLLCGEISKRLSNGRAKAQRLDDQKLVKLCQKASYAARELAKIMLEGYSIRIIADYNPEIFIDFSDKDRFLLNGMNITTAHSWLEQAKMFTATIEEAWAQIDGL